VIRNVTCICIFVLAVRAVLLSMMFVLTNYFIRKWTRDEQGRQFLISNFRCVLNVVCFLPGNSPAGNYPEESV